MMIMGSEYFLNDNIWWFVLFDISLQLENGPVV